MTSQRLAHKWKDEKCSWDQKCVSLVDIGGLNQDDDVSEYPTQSIQVLINTFCQRLAQVDTRKPLVTQPRFGSVQETIVKTPNAIGD